MRVEGVFLNLIEINLKVERLLNFNRDKSSEEIFMNKQKSDDYKKLVRIMQEKYPKYDKNSSNDYELYAPYVNGEMICQEINFYTYWQGLGYAERTPKIKYLFVGQDNGGGRLFDGSESTKHFIERIKKMNNGDMSIPYIDDATNESETDKNLITIFEDLGYDLHQRYDELFFTNFCLGYRRDSDVGMHREWMKKDSDLFKRLYDILEPENIITMGMRTFECVYSTLKGEDYPGLGANNFDNFKKLVSDRSKKIFVKRGRNSVPIYPIHHCGKHGIENLIADPLSILIEHMKPIKEKRLSPFAEYLFKLIDNYESKYKENHKLDTKIISDLQCGNTNVPLKRNIIYMIFVLRLSVEETLELISKTDYDFPSINDDFEDKTLEKVLDEEIVKHFKSDDKKSKNKKFNEKLIEIAVIYLIKQQKFDISFEDLKNKIEDRLYLADLEREKQRIEKLKHLSFNKNEK